MLFFSCISWREQVNFQWNDDEVRFVLAQHAEFDFYTASSLKQQSICIIYVDLFILQHNVKLQVRKSIVAI
jgi:cupin superfamily acireductone dioxygenase involved in methionine salvage